MLHFYAIFKIFYNLSILEVNWDYFTSLFTADKELNELMNELGYTFNYD